MSLRPLTGVEPGAPGRDDTEGEETVTTPAESLRATIERAMPRLAALGADATAVAPAPGKWSPREILGHLIDSALNNYARFVRATIDDDLVFPGYDQDAWVRVQRYASVPWMDLLALWRALNLHVARIMEAAPEEARLRPRARHNLDEIAWQPFRRDVPATLDALMRDYVAHLEHHLGQIPGI